MVSPNPTQDRRELARQRLEEAYRSNMAMLPTEVQAIIEAIPAEQAKRRLKQNITVMMEHSDPHALQHMWILLGGMFIYGHDSGHFDEAALTTLTKFRQDLRARKYISRGPFVSVPIVDLPTPV